MQKKKALTEVEWQPNLWNRGLFMDLPKFSLIIPVFRESEGINYLIERLEHLDNDKSLSLIHI